MIGALKTIGTVLTVASTAQFGKEMYDKYKDKKKAKQIKEVHEFIASLDVDGLQKAINSNDNEALISAVEDIMAASEAVKIKGDFEALAEDAQEVASMLFNVVTNTASKVVSKLDIDEPITEKKEPINENKTLQPTFEEFLDGAPLYLKDGTTIDITYQGTYINTALKKIKVVQPNKIPTNIKLL